MKYDGYSTYNNCGFFIRMLPYRQHTVNREAELSDSVDLRLNITDLENYINLCNNEGEETTLGNLTRRTSERCVEFPIDNGDRECRAGE